MRLIVSELVTNAVLHGGCGSEAPVRLRIDRRPSSVRMEVVDEGMGSTPCLGSPPTGVSAGGGC